MRYTSPDADTRKVTEYLDIAGIHGQSVSKDLPIRIISLQKTTRKFVYAQLDLSPGETEMATLVHLVSFNGHGNTGGISYNICIDSR